MKQKTRNLTTNQSGIPAEEFRTRLRQRIHAEALADEDDDEDETEVRLRLSTWAECGVSEGWDMIRHLLCSKS